jgi:hypothetical protein
MHKLFYLLAVIFLTAPSCELINDAIDPITFSIDGAEIPFTLDEQDEPGTFVLTAEDVSLGIQQELDAENVSSDRLTSVRPESILLRIISTAAPVDLSVIQAATVRIEAAGMAPVTFAAGDLAINAANTEAELNIADRELLDQLLAPTADYELSITITEAISEPVELGVRPRFRAEAEAL